jgi:HlyD family secretion protein
VKENQVVKKGDAIATIDNSRLQTQKRQLEGNIQQSQLQLAQIAAQISALDTQRASESSLLNRPSSLLKLTSVSINGTITTGKLQL